VAPETVVAGHLTHGNAVAVFHREQHDAWRIKTVPTSIASQHVMRVFAGDGVVSDALGLYFFMTFADCVPLLFLDRVRGVVGAAHAGWRGTALEVGPAVIQMMRAEFGSEPSDIVAAVGPSIGPCCYTVGQTVLDTFASRGTEPVVVRWDGSICLDLWATNVQQLRASGLSPASIESAHICTSCHVTTYFSHRAEGRKTGRFGLGIGLD
jgi:YfiH family protein